MENRRLISELVNAADALTGGRALGDILQHSDKLLGAAHNRPKRGQGAQSHMERVETDTDSMTVCSYAGACGTAPRGSVTHVGMENVYNNGVHVTI